MSIFDLVMVKRFQVLSNFYQTFRTKVGIVTFELPALDNVNAKF